MTEKKIEVSIRNLYKIFGMDPQSVLSLVKEQNIGKTELNEKHHHVLGLDNINIDIFQGEITVIMGLSGSGKSTLIRHLNRLIEPTAGEILMNGKNVLDYDQDRLRTLRQTEMSMVFQKFALLPHRTVLDNACMAPLVRGEDKKQANKDAMKWLERVGLKGFENLYPHHLSGGMQQRVGLARALTSNAPIMLMDEAFSALDPLIRTSMQDLLLELQKDLNKSIIFITHDLDEALKLADQLVILKDGKVIQKGEPQHILMNPSDPYIEDFISDINRARVLRVGTIMQPYDAKESYFGDVEISASLEDVIAHADGDTAHHYRVMDQGKPVGSLSMKELVKALVRTEAKGDTALS